MHKLVFHSTLLNQHIKSSKFVWNTSNPNTPSHNFFISLITLEYPKTHTNTITSLNLKILANQRIEMTKSNTSSESSQKTTGISVKPCCFNKTIKSCSSSPSDASLDISSPIQDFLNLTTSTPSSIPCNTNMTTIQDFLNLAIQTSSPKHGNTNIHTFQPSIKTSSASTSQQTQPSKTPSPQSPTLTPMELFHTPPTSPLPYFETLDDLSPKSSSPPSLSLFDTIA